jgi:hypothetical protein
MIPKTPVGANCICWKCKYSDWYIEVPLKGKVEPVWVDVCHNPAEYLITEMKQECEGFVKET